MLGLRQLGLDAGDAGVRGGGARWPAPGLLFECGARSSGSGLEGEIGLRLWFSQGIASSSRFFSACGEGENPGKSRGQLEVPRPPGHWGADVAVALSSRATQRSALTLPLCLLWGLGLRGGPCALSPCPSRVAKLSNPLAPA